MILSEEFKVEVRRWGWTRAFYGRLMPRLRRWAVFCRVSTQDLTQFEGNATVSPAEHRFATQSELAELLEELPDKDRGWLREVEPDQHNRCWASFVEGKIVSFGWSAYRNAPAGDGMMVGFNRPYMYGRNVYTLQHYRGKRIFDVSGAVASHIEKGYTHAIGFIETHNFASWRRARRMGDKHGGYAGYLKLGKLRIPFRTPLAKKHTFRFYRAE